MTRPRLKQQLGAGESGEEGDARFFHLAAQPLHKLVDRDNVVAVIAHGRRRDGELELARAGQVIDSFFSDGGIERRFLFEAGQQLAHGARIEQRAGETVRADFPRLFQEVDVFFGERRFRMLGIVLVNQLRQAQSARHAGRTSADDDYVCFHHRALDARKRLTKNDH